MNSEPIGQVQTKSGWKGSPRGVTFQGALGGCRAGMQEPPPSLSTARTWLPEAGPPSASFPAWSIPGEQGHQDGLSRPRGRQQEQPPHLARSLLCSSPQFADLCLKHRQLNYMGADAAKCIKALKCQASSGCHVNHHGRAGN